MRILTEKRYQKLVDDMTTFWLARVDAEVTRQVKELAITKDAAIYTEPMTLNVPVAGNLICMKDVNITGNLSVGNMVFFTRSLNYPKLARMLWRK